MGHITSITLKLFGDRLMSREILSKLQHLRITKQPIGARRGLSQAIRPPAKGIRFNNQRPLKYQLTFNSHTNAHWQARQGTYTRFEKHLSTSSCIRSSTDAVQPTSANGGVREYGTILLTRPDKHIAHIELDRPKAKNAFNLEMAQEFLKALKELEEDSSVRCLVLSGAGADFTSGVDIKSFMSVYAQLQETDDVGHRSKLLRAIVENFQLPFKQMYSFRKPIICVPHGLCYGLGMELAGCSDIRICSRDARMAIREVLIGIAADVGSLQLMPRLFSNQSLLNELILTGRDLKVDEALEFGFVSKILESKEAAMDSAFKMAKMIASRSPVAVQGSKQNLIFSRDKPFLVGLDYNAVWNMSMMQSNDVVKAITAIMSKTDKVDYDDY